MRLPRSSPAGGLVGAPAQHRAYDLLPGVPFPAEKPFAASMATIRREDMGALYARGWLPTHDIYVTTDDRRRAVNDGKPGWRRRARRPAA